MDGPDGSGKSGQIRLVSEILAQRGIECITTREPGGTPAAEAIRKLLLDPNIPLLPETEVVLHFAARRELVETFIKPRIAESKLVLSDRFFDSTTAYQCYGGGVSKEIIDDEIRKLNFNPEITIILTAPYEICLERRLKRDAGLSGDRYDRRSDDFTRRVHAGFLTIAKENNKRCIVVENIDQIETSQKIANLLEERYRKIYPTSN